MVAHKKIHKKKIKVAKGVSVPRGEESKMRHRKGSGSAGKYKNVSPKEFAGAAGGASKYSFPINTIKRARNALARAHFAPHPEGIRKKVYKEYPALAERHHKDIEKHADKMHSKHHVSKKRREEDKIRRVMEEYKHGKLHSGSRKGPKVSSRKQAIAIALSEARKLKRKRK